MKWIIYSLTLVILFPNVLFAQIRFRIKPYLQEVSSSEATVVFENNFPSISWVELRKKGYTQTTNFYQDIQGGHQLYADTPAPQTAIPIQNFAIPIDGLENNTAYQYRIACQEIKNMQPHSATIGDIQYSEWYTFNTLNKQASTHHLAIISDMHNRPDTLRSFLKALDHSTADHIIYAGDMMDNMQMGATIVKKPEEPYSSFLNVSTELFAHQKAFYMLRGDHETKGDIATAFSKYFPHRSGRLYNTYRWGDLQIVLLDGGEAEMDKDPTAHTSNMAAFNAYRQEQAEWLRQVIDSEEFRSAKYRIVISHLPIPNDRDDAENAGTTLFSHLMLPLLNQANIDLAISGHRHIRPFAFHDKGWRSAQFPTLSQGYHSALRIDIQNDEIHLKIVNKDGTEIWSKTMPCTKNKRQ